MSENHSHRKDEEDDDASSASSSNSDSDNESDLEGGDDSEADIDVDAEAEAEADDSDDSDNEHDPSNKIFKEVSVNHPQNNDDDNEDDDDNDSDEQDNSETYLQKFEKGLRQNIISDFHPELQAKNYEEILRMTTIIRNENGVIDDPFHKIVPWASKYEIARILGERARQLQAGAEPFIEIDDTIMDEYAIAKMELEQKKIPAIIERPFPGGGCEYWKIEDLEFITLI